MCGASPGRATRGLRRRGVGAGLLALALVSIAGLGWTGAGGCAAKPPNLIVISIDTLRPDCLGCYGESAPTSPTLDRLAGQGVLFEQASSPASWTVPGHAALLTGRYARSHGMRYARSRLPGDVTTLAQWLRRAGFETGGVVNVDLLDRTRGFARGFESYRVVPPAEAKDGAAQRINELALRWLEGRERPFFLFLHYYDVHSSYVAGAAYRRRFADGYDGPADGTTAQLKRQRLGEIDFDASDAEHLQQLYEAGVRRLDDALARLVTALEERGVLEDTLLVVTSDHGEEFLEHGGVLHGRTLYRELVHVPLIVRGPGIPAGRRIDAPVSLVDVAPTILAALGLPPLPGSAGRDVGPLWRGETLPERPLYYEADQWLSPEPCGTMRRKEPGRCGPKRAVRLEGWKLHRTPRGVELYHLTADPGETRDRAADRPARRARLSALLDAFTADERHGPLLARPSKARRERLRALGYLR